MREQVARGFSKSREDQVEIPKRGGPLYKRRKSEEAPEESEGRWASKDREAIHGREKSTERN